MNDIGKKLIQLRKDKGYSQEELAEKARISLRTIQRIENNENIPRGNTMQLICNVLDVDTKLLQGASQNRLVYYSRLILDGLFLVVLNLLLMMIIGFLTLDSQANFNSRVGGYLISFLLPFLVVYTTQKMNGLERIFKFGAGYFFYIILAIIMVGVPHAFLTGLLPCLAISLATLYYGERILDLIKTK